MRKVRKIEAKKENEKEGSSEEPEVQKKSKPKKTGPSALIRGISLGATAAEKAPTLVIIVVLLISSGAVLGAMELETEFDFEDFLPDDLEISQDLSYMMNEFSMGGGEAPEIQLLINGDITNPDLLGSIDTTIGNMADDEYVIQSGGAPSVKSISSLIKDWATNSTIHGFQDDNYDSGFQALYNTTFEADGTISSSATKDDVKALYDWLFLNPFSNRDARSLLHKADDGEYDATVLRIAITLMGTESTEMHELMDDIDADMSSLSSNFDSTVLTGGSIVGVLMLDLMNESQTKTLILTLIICLVFMVIVFYAKDRSIMLGVMTMLPVIFCVLWILGTMYVLGISLNIMTLMVTALTIGIGVDYGIHISNRFGEDLGVFDNISDAIRNTVSHTGLALFGGAATTIAGFGLISFATMPPIAQFGLITALTILYSSVTAVFVLPTFLVMWAKWKKKRSGTPSQDNESKDKESEVNE
jgi:predicted RND superfamily exporter protein